MTYLASLKEKARPSVNKFTSNPNVRYAARLVKHATDVTLVNTVGIGLVAVEPVTNYVASKWHAFEQAALAQEAKATQK